MVNELILILANALSVANNPDNVSITMIGTVHLKADRKTFIYKCVAPECTEKTLNRWPDLKRHYNGAHALDGAEHWCEVHGCRRSDMNGGRPFPRKDKLNDHMRQAHGFAQF